MFPFRKNKSEDFSLTEFKPRAFPLEKRLKEEKKPQDGRWVFGLLLASVCLSAGLFLWGKASRGELWPKSPVLVVINQPTPTPTPLPKAPDNLLRQIDDLTGNLQGLYGFYAYNLTTKQAYGLHQNETFTAASLMKLPVMITFYQEVEKGNLSPETKYSLLPADKRVGAGSLQSKPAGTVYTYRQLMELMGKQSDNTAFTAMRRLLTDEKIQNNIKSWGMVKTNLVESESSPAEIGLLFRKLYGGSLVTREHRDEILSYLTKTAYEDRIPAGIPSEVRVAHKVGSEVGVFADGGIIFAPKPFVLVIMTESALEKEAKIAVPKIAGVVWQFETGE